MNPAKSKYDPGPAPKSSTTMIESDENKYKVDGHTVNADGTETPSLSTQKLMARIIRSAVCRTQT